MLLPVPDISVPELIEPLLIVPLFMVPLLMVPLVVPGEVVVVVLPGCVVVVEGVVWAKAALVVRAKAAAKIREAFMGKGWLRVKTKTANYTFFSRCEGVYG